MKPVSLKNLLLLAIPAAVSVLLNNAFKVIDQYSVQWLGKYAQAAIGSCTFILLALFAIYSVVSSGSGPLIARATGSGNHEERRRIIGNALFGATLIGALVLMMLAFWASTICDWLGLRGEVHALAVEYLQWLAVMGFPIVLAPVIDTVFIAVGRTALVMGLQFVATALNILLNPFFIYTLDFGIAGAAMATGISRGISVLIGLWFLLRQFRPAGRDFWPDSSLRRIIRIGLPLSWGIALYALVYWALLRYTISPLGPAVNAALGIGYSALEGFTWPIFWGISMGVASLIGRYIGAGQVDQARRTILLAFPLMTLLGIAAGCIFWFGSESLCRLFTDDPGVLEQAVLYARILAFSQLLVAYECLAEAVLEGSGDTRPILFWSAPWNIARIPFSWYFGIYLAMGPAAIWWVINVTTLIKAAGKWSAVIRGNWQSIRI